MFCRYCGKEINDTAKFCNYCGKENGSNLQAEKIISKKNTEKDGDKKMGMFDKNYEKSIDNIEDDIKKYLSPKDGNTHIILINSMTKSMTNGWECENKYTLQIDGILKKIQDEGYEIVDIKFESMQQPMVGNAFLIRTLIIYK